MQSHLNKGQLVIKTRCDGNYQQTYVNPSASGCYVFVTPDLNT